MRKMDINTKWICILSGLIVVCIGGMLAVGRMLPQPSEPQAQNFVSIPWTVQLIYFTEEKRSGVPWVLLAGIDAAEERTADAAHTRLAAQTLLDAGAEQRGLFVLPFATAADAVGLYNTDRSFIKRAASEVLALSQMDGVIRSAAFPSQTGTPQNDWATSDSGGCSVEGTDVITPVWEGAVVSVTADTVQIQSQHGLVVSYQGLSAISVQTGQTVSLSTPLGHAPSFTLYSWQNGQAFNPYPLLYLLAPSVGAAD